MGRRQDCDHVDTRRRRGRHEIGDDRNAIAVRGWEDHDPGVRARRESGGGDGLREAVMKWTAALALALAVGVGAYVGRGLLTARTPPANPPTFSQATMRTIAATVTTTGVIRLRVGAEVRVGTQVSGIVQKLNVTVGSHIRRDDVIAEIDSRGLEARLSQANAQVTVAEQAVRRAEVEQTRAEQLGDRQLVPRQQVEDATLTLQGAKAQLHNNRRDAAVVATALSYAAVRA